MGVSRRFLGGAIGASILVLSAASLASAQPLYEVIADIGTLPPPQPRYPHAGLLRGSDGHYYGVAAGEGFGSIFRLSSEGAVAVLHVFDGTDGNGPYSALVEGSDGNLYGTTNQGGVGDLGTIFKIGKSGDFTSLHHFAPQDSVTFCTPDGGYPWGPLIEGTDGLFYGTAQAIANCDGASFLFRVSASGAFELLPSMAQSSYTGLTRGADGYLYGITYGYPAKLFRLSESSGFEIVYVFNEVLSQGTHPIGSLTLGSDGLLYGTTRGGGTGGTGPGCQFGCGTVFRFDPSSQVLTTLHSFSSAGAAGVDPVAGLIEHDDGWLYGTTAAGGTFNLGTVYRVHPVKGQLQAVHAFQDGNAPYATLLDIGPGVFLGVTGNGGTNNLGTVFRLTVPPSNLTIASLSAPASTVAGATIKMTDVSRNTGTGLAPATMTRFWLSTDKVLGGDVAVGARFVPQLSPGTQHKASTFVTVPDVVPGTYYLIARADADEDVTETTEADNTRVKAVVIGPDLTLVSLAVPSGSTSTTPTTITVRVKNLGGAVAAPSVTRLYRSANGKIDASDTVLVDIPLASIAPGETVTQEVTRLLPAGSYYLIATADATSLIEEAKETNNLRKANVVIP